MIRDQYHDPAFTHLYHILNEHPDAREFVKSASLAAEAGDALPDRAFAWPEERRFPINTAENTVLSSLYRQKCAMSLVPSRVDDALEKAQGIYGVKALIQRAKVAAAPVDDSDDYLLPKYKRLRVKTAAHIPAAEGILLRDYPNLNIEDRAEAFVNLVKKARDMGVDLRPETRRMAGMTLCTTKVAQDFIEARAAATKEPLFRTAYDKLASAFQGRGEFIQDRDELIAVADALARLDKQAGLVHHYDKRLPDPICTVFNTTKTAEETVDMAGTAVALSKLASMPKTWWADVVGDDIASEFSEKTGEELRQVLDTLPLDLKLIIRNQVR